MHTYFLQVLTGAAVATALAAPPAHAQDGELTLRRALQHAEANAVAVRIARAGQDEAAAAVLATRRSMLPAFRVEAGAVRTTDPVGAFGTSLRQQRITQQDFDPGRLNFPAAINNFTGALVVEQPLIAVDGWLASRAATLGTQRATSAAEWVGISTQADVVVAWYGVILAGERATTLTAASRAADAHARQALHLLEAGLVTKSDALLAEARAGDLEALRLDAIRDSILAGRQLALLIGLRDRTPALIRGSFPDDSILERAARDIEQFDVERRADVVAAVAGRAAATADVNRARAALLPRIGTFARRDLNSSTQPFTGASNWTVGVMASWSLFNGASEIAERRMAEARKAGAAAQVAGIEAAAAIDVERTALTLQTARSRLAISRRTVDHAREAHRIVAKKYAGGLATVVELLDAAATEMQSRLGLSAARHGLIAAMADRLRAIGHEPARLAALAES